MEAIDLKNPAYVCGALPDVGVSSLFATGNTYNGKAVFCGGNLSEDDCYIFNPENQMWESFAGLLAPRRKHASVQLTEDSFWILGSQVNFLTG